MCGSCYGGVDGEVLIINPSSAIASFVVPDTPNVYTLNLTVTDPGGAQDTDQILITAVTASSNTAPTPVILISAPTS